MSTLTDASDLLNAPTYVVVTTVNPDGQPQSSVVWTRIEGDTVVFSTTRSRRKGRNLERDPRITMIAYDPSNPYRYVEVRGTATLTDDPGGSLLDELSQVYTGGPWQGPNDDDRVIVRVAPDKVLVR